MRGIVAAVGMAASVLAGCSGESAPPQAPPAPAPAPAPASPPSPNSSPTSSASPTSPATSSASPSSSPAPAPPAAPAPLPVTSAVAVVAGQEAPLARDGVTTVDPAAVFRVEVATRLSDGRLALLDEADAMVGSTGTTELGGSFTRYRLAPAEALRPGSRYRLRLEGAVGREAHDAAGRAYGPLVHELRTSGERPAAPAPKRRKGRP